MTTCLSLLCVVLIVTWVVVIMETLRVIHALDNIPTPHPDDESEATDENSSL